MSATETKSRTPARSSNHATLADVKSDVQTLKSDVGDCVTPATERSIEAVKHGADSAVETGKKLAESASDAHQSFSRYVSNHPTASILIAFGAGAMLSRLLPRK